MKKHRKRSRQICLLGSMIVLVIGWLVVLLGLQDRAVVSPFVDSHHGTAFVGQRGPEDVKSPQESNRSSNSGSLGNETQAVNDGPSFNNLPAAFRTGAPPSSKEQCVGYEHHWMYRSCFYQNVCLDIVKNRFVLVGKGSREPTTVAAGPYNPRWAVGSGIDRGVAKLAWRPENRINDFDGYYWVNATVVPFHSIAGHNVGHLLWDDLYSVHTAIKQFVHVENNLALVRLQLNETLYASCDIRRKKRLKCKENFAKFVPLLFGVDEVVPSRKAAILDRHQNRSPLVCFSSGVAGMGLYQDHGTRDHGWEKTVDRELRVPHNLGRGRQFYGYAYFLLRNAGAVPSPAVTTTRPTVTFSLRSSSDWARQLDFQAQIEALSAEPEGWHIQAYEMSTLSLPQQIVLAQSTNVFVTACGGGAMTATFLPRGATLIVLYDAMGGLDFAALKSNFEPAPLDWDLLNNAQHLVVHWLPVNGMDNLDGIRLFQNVVEHEISRQTRMRPR